MLGFDYTKLNTPDHTTPKYVFARATQDVTLAWDRASRSAGLQQIVDTVKQNGYPNATVTGKDSIDFGDGNGTSMCSPVMVHGGGGRRTRDQGFRDQGLGPDQAVAPPTCATG